MPSSGARSGTPPSRPKSAGDGSIGRKRALKCGCGIPVEQEPVAVTAGRRWYVCPNHTGLQEPVKK